MGKAELTYYGFTMEKGLWPAFRKVLVKRGIYFESSECDKEVWVEVKCSKETAKYLEDLDLGELPPDYAELWNALNRNSKSAKSREEKDAYIRGVFDALEHLNLRVGYDDWCRENDILILKDL